MGKTDKEALQNLMDIKEFKSIQNKALAHVASRQWGIYKNIEKWQAMTPTLGIDQQQINQVIEGQEKHNDMFDYIYNLILNDSYDS